MSLQAGRPLGYLRVSFQWPHLPRFSFHLFIPPGLLIIHGMLNSLSTRYLARFTSGMVFINLGTTAIIIIVLLATTPRSEMHPAGYVFESAGVVNQTGGWPTGLAFLMGLLSVQWTVSIV